MAERLRSYGNKGGVEIRRFEYPDGRLSGIIFEARGMLMTARHVVDSRVSMLPGFVSFPDYDQREVDIAIRRDENIMGMDLGYTEWWAPGCYCVTSSLTEPEKLRLVSGRMLPYYEPTLQSEFVPDSESDYVLFESGTSGSPIICRGMIIGFVTASNPERKIVTGISFNLAPLRETLSSHFGLEFIGNEEE